ncbi:MAG: RNA methyltransferase [Acidilobus sp.]
MRLRLVVVGPEGPVNLGYIARLAENFEVDELAIVAPQASFAEAYRWAARAWQRLTEARVYATLKDALKGVELTICTSDESSARDVLRTPVTPEEAASEASRRSFVALVMGRESVGLTRDELALCDMLCTIPTSSRYTALNVSNATAILLYEIFKASKGARPLGEAPQRSVVRWAEAYARALWRTLASKEQEEEAGIAIRKIVSRSHQAEASILLRLLSRACASLGCKGVAEEVAKALGEPAQAETSK